MDDITLLGELVEPSMYALDPLLLDLLTQIVSQLNTIMTLFFYSVILSLAILFTVLIWTLFKRFIEQY